MRPAHDKNYFHFTRKERNGIIFLSSLAFALVFASIIYPYLAQAPEEKSGFYAEDIAKLTERAPDTASRFQRYKRDYTNYKSTRVNNGNAPRELFSFDPNTLSAAGWKRLGLHDKTIGTIQNYLNKGGRFRQADDLKKIWGLDGNLARLLIPYVRIEAQTENNFISASHFKKSFPAKSYPAKTFHTININQSDTSAFTALPGIGPKLSSRIIKYRDKLGGFYSVDQVAQTFGLPDSTFKKIRQWLLVDKSMVKKININTATLDELKAHPYIRYHLANALVQYRQQHKTFASVNEIRNIMLVDDTTYQKLVPYLTVESY